MGMIVHKAVLSGVGIRVAPYREEHKQILTLRLVDLIALR
jgi:hypothetical protein